MPCTSLPSQVNPATGQIRIGQLVSPRGLWNPRFPWLPQCANLLTRGVVPKGFLAEVENAVVFGNSQVQNAWPPFAFTANTTFIPGAGIPPVLPSVQVSPWLIPGGFFNMIPDVAVVAPLFIDDCILDAAYPEGEWQFRGPYNPIPGTGQPAGPASVTCSTSLTPSGPQITCTTTPGTPAYPGVTPPGCTYAFIVVAPQGTGTTIGPHGAQVLNYCPIAEAEIDGDSIASWRPCIVTNSNPATGLNIVTNTCPGTLPGYPTQCNTGSFTQIAIIDNRQPNTMTWMRGLIFRTQVHYLIPHQEGSNWLLVSTMIQNKQVY